MTPDEVVASITSAAQAGIDDLEEQHAAELDAAQNEIDSLTTEVATLAHDLDVALNPTDELLRLDLSEIPLGKVTAVNITKAFGQTTKLGADTTWKDFTVIADPDGTRFLRWTSRRSTEGSANGISLAIPLAARVDDATFCMGVRFSAGFGWSLGGKIPGLSMTTPGTSGTLAGGGVDPKSKAASNRHMWVTPATGTFPQPDGSKHKAIAPAEMTSYVYLDGVTEQERFWGIVPPAGAVLAIKSRDLMNTFAGGIAQGDGKLEAWADGVQVRDDTLRWRTDPTCQISHLFWSIFRGGPNNDPKWADPDAVPDYIDIADGLTVTTPRT